MWVQKQFTLPPFRRGFHLVTPHITRACSPVGDIEIGLLHLFIQHTSASLALNENADPTVRQDLESHFNVIAPADASYYTHIYEGSDDMPAHIKAIIIGPSLSLPIQNGRLALGMWQGIYLCEHRDRARGRTLMATINGQPFENIGAR